MINRTWIFGSSPDCDVWIPKSTVSAKHCRLTCSPCGYQIEDLGSSNGTLVNSQAISTKVSIEPKTNVTLGKQTILPWPDVGSASRVVRFGRAADNDFVVQAAAASSHHGQIIVGPNGTWVVEDLGSTNGTGLRMGNEVTPFSRAAMIGPDDTLMLGTYALPVANITPLLYVSVAEPVSSPQHQVPFGLPAGATSSADELPLQLESAGDNPYSKYLAVLVAGITVVVLIAAFGFVFFGGAQKDHAFSVSDASISGQDELGLPSASNEAIQQSPLNAGVAADTKADDQEAALFWVLVASEDDSLTFRVGTAFAIDKTRLVTTGSIVRAVESLAKQGYPQQKVVHLSSGAVYSIGKLGVHASLPDLIDNANELRSQYQSELSTLKSPEDSTKGIDTRDVEGEVQSKKMQLVQLGEQMLKAEQAVIDFDAGWIETSASLSESVSTLTLSTKQAPRPRQKLTIISAPFDIQDPYFDTEMKPEFVHQELRITTVLNLPEGHRHRLVLEDQWRPGEVNLFGSPLVDAQFRVIGVLSRNEMLSPEQVHVDAVGAAIIHESLSQ